MPFPALSGPVSGVIGVSIGAIGFVVQESLLRRRAARRRQARAAAGATAADSSAPASPDVTAVPPPPATAVRKAPTPRRPKAAAAKPAAPVKQVAQQNPARATATRTTPRPKATTGATPRAATPRAATPRAATPRPSRRATPADPLAALRKRQAALNRGLEAIVEFVDGPARRAGATACADALLLAVPKGERGPQVSHFLHAAGAKESPARLQEMAEDAGVELAIALKALAAEIRARSGS